MKDVILKVENVSKQYRLGVLGTGSITHDLNRWWYKIRGKDDPYLKVGEVNDRAQKGESDYVWALKNINFDVHQGEVLGIIGKNGAGKSTLLKILSKVTGPTTGSIKSKGRIASLLEVGTGFHPEMTGRENIYLNGAILGMTKKEINSKIAEIIEFSGCERYIDTPTKRYSSGMTVRLAFAVAAFLEPDILVVDEVLAVGDAEFQKKAIGKMQDISKSEGRTVLFVSHNMTAVKNLCTRGVIIDKGEISFTGNIDNVIDKYMSNNIEFSKETLSNRTDRKGNQLVFFESIVFNKSEPVFVGKSLDIELYYTAKENISSIAIALTFCKGYEERVMTVDNVYQGVKIDISKGKGIIQLSIPILYLLPGTYSINLWTANYENVLDYVFNATSLIVEEADFYSSGKSLNTDQHGVFYPEKSKWNVI